MMTRFSRLSAALLLSVTALAANSFGALITFTYTGTGAGSLNGVPFASSAFTITAVGDTDNRQSYSSGYFINHDSASITITGLGTFGFIPATDTFVNNDVNTPGFSRVTGGGDLYNGPTALPFGSWDMLSSIGPIGGTMTLLQWGNGVATTGGLLDFADANTQGTFAAVVGAASVPDASSTLVLLGCALAALAGVRRKLAL
jgi:hypothetical protein